MKMIKIFITDIIQDENVHIIEEIYFHEVTYDCMSEDGRERKNAFRVFTQSEYEEVMEKGYFVMYEPDADLLLGWY